MTNDALDRLIACAQALPPPTGLTVDEQLAPRGPDRRRRGLPAVSLTPPVLRARVHELIAELAQRTDDALSRALAHAEGAWDQVDALRILDRTLDEEVRTLRATAARMSAEEDAVHRAVGLEAQLTVDAVAGLVRIVERRLATLVRLRLRATADDRGALVVDGRPFLDLGAALHEAARRWL
jgi:hypothetical protein